MARAEVLKAVLLILCIGVLWPAIFGYTAPWYTALMVAVLAMLVVMLVLRVRQMNREFAEARRRRDEELGLGFPFVGPDGDAGRDPAEDN